MTRSIWLAALLLAACGEVTERKECSASVDCPLGEYCARTSDGSVCWPDATPPGVSGLTVVCGPAPCVRDGELTVSVEVADDAEVLTVEARVDFDPEHPFALTRGVGTTWTGTIPLAELPFPAYTREAIVTVRALDGARNEASAVALEGQRPVVTRGRWGFPAGAPLTAPAITSQGDVVVARSALSGQVLAVHEDGAPAWALTVGSGTITSPPSIGAEAIWVGANDGKLYAVALDGSGELPARRCTASGSAKGPPAVLTTSGVDVAFGAFSNGRIYASGPSCVPTAATPGNDPYTTGPAIDGDGVVYAATSTLSLKAMRRNIWDGEAFGASWVVDLGETVTAPLAVPMASTVLSGSSAGEIELTTVGAGSGSLATLATLAGSISESPIILSNGDVVVGDESGKLHRLASDGTPVWSPPVDLGAPVHAPMALTGGPIRFLVATADGRVHALDDGGAILWSGALTAGQALGAGNLYTPPGSAISTAYFGGADGVLYAVAVEGSLDTTAPWPKAWHDPRNTSRAGGP